MANMIVKLWVQKIIEGSKQKTEGSKTFADVPSKLKDSVRKLLIEQGYDDF